MFAAVTVLGLGAACTTDRSEPPQSSGPATGAPAAGTVAPVGVDTDYPGSLQDYAEATVGAWAAPDLARLADLAAPEVHALLLDLPGPPDPRWSFVSCDDEAQSCRFYNFDGDELVVWVDPDGLGASQAATDITFDPTRYPRDPFSYLEEFVAAWWEGNLARMQALAAPEVVEVYRELTPQPDPDYLADADGAITVRLDEASVTTEVDSELLGGPRAIVSAELPLA